MLPYTSGASRGNILKQSKTEMTSKKILERYIELKAKNLIEDEMRECGSRFKNILHSQRLHPLSIIQTVSAARQPEIHRIMHQNLILVHLPLKLSLKGSECKNRQLLTTFQQN
jgi:hypothetical protein